MTVSKFKVMPVNSATGVTLFSDSATAAPNEPSLFYHHISNLDKVSTSDL